ncbi:hypothetical protein NUW58_g6455 [Xylaria curta]|uniref:Uncharacterized protein n=1 Tax=Xylaria curta TaxID=42375 RepID=A0ACC1NST2_9PEZI|nr:hypothetical protein NUW58_g6455 [Xylaria curta]
MDRAYRNFLGRKHGLMKKANVLHRKHDARITVFVEKNNTLFCYQSDPSWPMGNTLSVEPQNKLTPDNFDTVADRVMPAGRDMGATRPGSPYSSGSFSSGGELQAVNEASHVLGTAPAVPTSDQPELVNSPSVLAMREYSPSFLPMLDMELQSGIAQQEGLLPLWDATGVPGGSCLDPSSGSSPPLPKKARYTTPDTHRNDHKSQPGQKRTPIRKSTRYQAKQYF